MQGGIRICEVTGRSVSAVEGYSDGWCFRYKSMLIAYISVARGVVVKYFLFRVPAVRYVLSMSDALAHDEMGETGQ